MGNRTPTTHLSRQLPYLLDQKRLRTEVGKVGLLNAKWLTCLLVVDHAVLTASFCLPLCILGAADGKLQQLEVSIDILGKDR